jgi:hypothetical protein
LKPKELTISSGSRRPELAWFQFRTVALLHLSVGIAVILAAGRMFSFLAAAWMVAFYALFLLITQIRGPRHRRSRVGMALLRVFVFAAIAWIAALVFPPLSLVVPILCAYLLANRRYVSLGLLLTLSPLGFSFAFGVIDYCRGRAELRYSGYPSPTGNNLDPELRCGRSTGGCLVYGDEWMFQEPYNGAVRLATTWFGPMPGTYTGPYPTETEAIAAVAEGVPIPAEELLEDRVPLAGEVFRLDSGVGQGLVRSYRFHHLLAEEARAPTIKYEPVKAVLWQKECIILSIPADPEYGQAQKSAMIVLVARDRGRPFAYYAEGQPD